MYNFLKNEKDLRRWEGSKKEIYSETKKYPHGRDFSMQNLTVFADLSKIYWILKNLHKTSIEAQICG